MVYSLIRLSDKGKFKMFSAVKTIAALLFTSSISFAANADILMENGGDMTNYGNDSIVYSFDNIGEHDAVLVNFDLFVFDSWDGQCENKPSTCNDYFGMEVNGAKHLWTFNRTTGAKYLGDETVENDIDKIQGSYNDVNSWGAIDVWYTDFFDGFYIPHAASTFEIRFFGEGLQGLHDESWAVNNLTIKTVQDEQLDFGQSFLVNEVPVPLSAMSLLAIFPLLRNRRVKK